MLTQGLVAEVEALYRRGDLRSDLPSMRAVGYRQVWDYLDGQTGYDEMRDRAVTATRQLAKRQMTWLRAAPELTWFDSRAPGLGEQVLNFLASAPINWP
jgi:tRNA dimethylallyltransferase